MKTHRLPIVAAVMALLSLTIQVDADLLLARYSFDGDFTDNSSNGNDLNISSGTPNITSASAEVKFGSGALNLDQSGTGEHLSFSVPHNFDGTSTWSMAWWGKRSASSLPSQGMIAGTITTSTDFVWTPDNSGVIQGLRLRDGSNVNTNYGSIADDNAYHHWAISYDGSGNVTVWRDNLSLGTKTFSGEILMTHIGAGTATINNSFFGQIDELHIFDEAIDAVAVDQLFNNTDQSDTTPPTLSGSDIVDNTSGGPVIEGSLIIYTVSFSEDMIGSTVEISDFGNAGTASFIIGGATETAPGIFRLEVSPTSTGTLQLQVNAGVVLFDNGSNPLNTTSPIPDDTTIQVIERVEEADPALVAYFSFDNSFEDDSGNINHLTIAAGSPGITNSDGESVFGGGALDLTSSVGDVEYLDLFSPLQFADEDPWSISFWVRRRANSDERQGMILGDTTNPGDFIWAADNPSQVQGLRFRSSLPDDADFGTFVDDGQFHHWVVISDGAGTISAYRDSVPQDDVLIGGALRVTSVGQAFNNNIFSLNGQIDELYIYDEAIDATKVATLFNGTIDNSPPTLTGSQIVDDQNGGPVTVGTLVTFTLMFSEDMDGSSVDAADFGNAGSASLTIGLITEVSPGVFTVQVTPTTAGTLQLEIVSSASLSDTAGNPLETTAAIPSDTVLSVDAALGPADVQRVRVVLLGGQSNADGRADPSGLPTTPVDLQAPQPDVDFYEDGTLATLQPFAQFGPEITLGRRLSDVLGNDPRTRIAIMKYAVGGTDLFSDWLAGGDNTTAGDGPNYSTFQSIVADGMSALAAAYPNAIVEIDGMLWIQGERDAGNAEASNYEANLTNFITDIRLTYGQNLWFIVSRLASNQTAVNSGGLAIVRAAQSAVAAADPLSALLDTDGFGMKSDDLHFDAMGQQQIGLGAADALLDFYPFLSPPTIMRQGGGSFEITLNDSFSGFLYTLWESPDLKSGNWSISETETATSSLVTFTFIASPSQESRFFYVERTQAP